MVIATCRFSSVANNENWIGNLWRWKIDWNLDIHNTELMAEAKELADLLLEVQPIRHKEDGMVWPYEEGNIYSVKIFYIRLLQSQQERLTNVETAKALKIVWKAKVSQMAKRFAWRLLHDRLPTRIQLARRGIISNDEDKLCVLCNELSQRR